MPPEVAGWRAFYTDGRRFASRSTAWAELPSAGVLGVVVYRDPPYRDLVSGGDWYYLDEGIPTSTGTHPEWGAWVDPPDVPRSELKRARAVDDATFEAVQEEMFRSTTWP